MGDIVLMNVWELLTEPRATFPSGPEKWSFLRYRFDGAALAIDVLQEEPLKEQSHAQAVETVRRRINDDVLFEPFAVCTRQQR